MLCCLAVRLAVFVGEFVEIVPVLVAVGSGDFTKVPHSKGREKKAEGFEDICTAELIDMKTRMKKAISCVMPSNITPEQIKKTIDEIIIQLKSNRDKILKDTITPVAPQLNSAGSSKMENAISADILGDSNKLFEELKRRIDRTKDALDYLNNKKKEVEDLAGSVSSSIPATAAT